VTIDLQTYLVTDQNYGQWSLSWTDRNSCF